jgi:hypothetical protein
MADRHERKQPEAELPQTAPPDDPHSAGAGDLPPLKPEGYAAAEIAPRGQSMAEQSALKESAAPPQEAGRLEPKPGVASGVAREIKLELTGGDRRVEVRLSDRAGEVRVAVRTPDSHLAGTLRENLPELSTRLAETGMRSEVWRPAGSAAAEWRHTSSPQAGGNLAQDGESPSQGQGGHPQGNPRERRQPDFQEQPAPKEKGKEFAWLMSTLR